VQPLIHAKGQDDHGRTMGEQFLDIGDLDTRYMPGPRLRPIPLASTTGYSL
jgi:hypothetical protein